MEYWSLERIEKYDYLIPPQDYRYGNTITCMILGGSIPKLDALTPAQTYKLFYENKRRYLAKEELINLSWYAEANT